MSEIHAITPKISVKNTILAKNEQSKKQHKLAHRFKEAVKKLSFV